MARLVRFEYHRPGKRTSSFNQWVVLDRPDVKVLLSDAYEGPNLEVGDTVVHDSGAAMVWYVFPEKWHDIGRFHLSDGTLTGWYTNIIKPVEIRGDLWTGHDLFLDLWQPVEGEPVWLDEDELDEASRSNVIDTLTRKRIDNERLIIDLQVEAGAWPPPIVRDVDLAQARVLREAFG
jgi:hypothetical protein